MKKLIIAFAVVVFSMVSTVKAQTTEKTSKEQTAKHHKSSLHCYMMKDGAMMECWGKTGKAMTKDATLKNGTTVSMAGEITTKDGKKDALKDNQCIIAKNGEIMDFAAAHPKSKMHKDEKMMDKTL
ncbi:DUF6799 domain-containing protein [Pedobacter sp. ASV1-7]|uniref:DUF6799 domain-containing protein n=1 Tax=Pedobacter sp. ASV1-7 TaxID=3145237 RepID=UPI0032E8B85B